MDIPQSEIHDRPNDVFIEGEKGFAQVPYAFLDSMKDANAVFLYNILVQHADYSTRKAHPSRHTLAKRMGFKTPRPVDAALKILQEAGWVKVFPRWARRLDNGTWETSITPKSGKGWGQSSNGYIVMRTAKPPVHDSDLPPVHDSDLPPVHDSDLPPVHHSAPKREPIEREPIERDKPPLVPPRGETRAGASAGEEPTGGTTAAELVPVDNPKPKPAKRTDRGTRLEDDWMPTQRVIDQMRQECPHVDLEHEHRKFVDYWQSTPGARGRKTNWDATWRNWIRRASERPGGGNHHQPHRPPAEDQNNFEYYANRLIERLDAQEAQDTNQPQLTTTTQWEITK